MLRGWAFVFHFVALQLGTNPGAGGVGVKKMPPLPSSGGGHNKKARRQRKYFVGVTNPLKEVGRGGWVYRFPFHSYSVMAAEL